MLFGEVFGIIVQADLLECKTLLINLGLLLRKHGFLGLIVVGVRTVQQGLVQHAAVDQGEVEGLLLLGLLLGPQTGSLLRLVVVHILLYVALFLYSTKMIIYAEIKINKKLSIAVKLRKLNQL